MQLDDIERYGLSPRVTALWRARQGSTLLPVQKQAIRKGLLGQPHMRGDSLPNLIIAAPTSAGKSFCAEMAAMRAVSARQKAVLLFPLKSLAEEKFRLFQDSYSSLGIETLLVTGDYPENDRRFADGRYQIAMVIYEKFEQLLTARLDVLQTIALVVIDELQMIVEPGRGALLERLITKILASAYHPTLLAMTAVIGEHGTARLARWLNAEIAEDSIRPVDLIRGVAVDGSLKYRSYNDGLDGSASFSLKEVDSNLGDLLLRQIKGEGGSVLVFMKSRRDTIELSFRLAASVNWPSADSAVLKLQDEEPSALVRSLCQALSRGVAFHNADLSVAQRRIVEQAFLDKQIRVLFSTTTLALGVNLPADIVYLETVKYASGIYGSRPTLVPITRAEFDNMTGRAGRLGFQQGEPGRAVVLAETEFDRDILWNTYIAPTEWDRFESAFESIPFEDWALHMIVAGLAPRENNVRTLLEKTFWHLCGQATNHQLQPALVRLTELGLITRDANSGELSATTVGVAVATAGLSIRQAAHFLRASQVELPATPFGWLALLLSSPDWDIPAGMLSRREQMSNAAVKLLYQRFDYSVEEAGYLLPEQHRKEPLAYHTAAALKAALLLDDWCRLTPVPRLEEQYQLHLGQIVALGETVAHLATALAALLQAVTRDHPAIESLRLQAFSLRAGLPVELCDLYEQFGSLLNRADCIALHHAGIISVADLCGWPADKLATLIPPRKLERLQHKLASFTKEDSMNAPYLTPGQLTGSTPDSIEIDGAYEGDRYLIRINGFPLRLTGKSFKYFTKLAWSRLHHETGWVYKEDLEVGFNQARYLYRMKNEINLGLRSSWPIFENNRLGYYRLDIDPNRVRINLDNLRSHPDYELQQLTRTTPGKPTTEGISASLSC